MALLSCPNTDDPGAIFDPGMQTGGGGDPNGPSVVKGPSGPPVAGSLSLAGSPKVSTVHPNGQNISIETPVCVTFNESVQLSTVTPASLLLRVQQGSTLISSVSSFGGGRFFVLLPAAPLPTNRTIEVVATNVIRDLDGFPLTVPPTGIIGSFQTEVTPDAQTIPTVVASFPPNNATNVSPGSANFGTPPDVVPGTPTQVITVFSEPIAPSSILGDLTANPPIEGLSLTQIFDPDGAGSQNPQLTVLIPGSGAFLQPEPTHRVWTATPASPFKPAAQILHRVGAGVTSDDIVPQSLGFPGFQSIFDIAALEPPQFVGIVTETGLSTDPAFLNNAPPPAPNSAGAFTAGVMFPSSSLSTDDVEIRMHDSSSTGTVLFKKKAINGAGEGDYSALSIFGKNGISLLKDPTVVLAARTKRGNVFSPWTVGPSVNIDTVVPTVSSYGPPAVGPVLYSASRISSIYGQATETPAFLRILTLESPQGVPIPVPESLTPQEHLMATNGSLFVSYPTVPAPVITALTPGLPIQEPQAKATFKLGDTADNESNLLTVNLRFRGRMGGPFLTAHQTLTVVVFDEDTLTDVVGATVLIDKATPTGTLVDQRKKTTAIDPSTGDVNAQFLAGVDFTPGTSELTVTAAAPGYDITTVIACPTAFISIPIRKTAGSAATNPPTLTMAPQGVSTGAKLDLIVNARPDLADRWVVPSIDSGAVPAFPPVTVPASRLVYTAGYVKASEAFSFTYVNDAFGFPLPPVVLGGSNTAALVFGQSYNQTAAFDDDPVSVPPAGGITAVLPRGSFDAGTVQLPVEVALTVPGRKVGVIGQVAVGEGRAGLTSGANVPVATSFNPKVNTTGLFKKIDVGTGKLVADIIDPFNYPTDVRFSVRAEDAQGNIARTLALATSTFGPVSAINLPTIPAVQPSTPAGAQGTLAPKIWWDNTIASLYVAHLGVTSGSTVREWRVFVRIADTDQSVFGLIGLQLPSLTELSGAAGTPLPSLGSLVSQWVDAITNQEIDAVGFSDFFFDDLRFTSVTSSYIADLRFARSKKVEIVY
jgi:hypothetical protein